MDIPFTPAEITAACTNVHWWLATTIDGALKIIQHGDDITPTPEQEQWALRMAELLQREIHHDGRWAVAWTDPAPVVRPDATVNAHHPKRWTMVFMDRDGDVQFQVSVTDPLWECVRAGPLVFIRQAEEAWSRCEERKRLADIRPGIDTFQRARGERAAAH
jgi:hypothetical protein